MSNICLMINDILEVSLMIMELRHLRYFIAVAEELHFGRAAEKLCIAQPPLSQQIQQLERELGFLLFHRTNRRVELSAAGQMFLNEARDVMASLEKAVHAGRRVARGETGWLGIGFVGSATYQALPAVLSAYRERYPDVELVLRELVSGKQIQALRDKRIHVGFARPAIQEEDILSEIVLGEPLMAALPETHRLSSTSALNLSALADEPFILFPRHPSPSFADYLLAVCGRSGFRPHVVQETSEIHTAISLVAAGVGVTLVPASVQCMHREGVVFAPLENPAPVTELALAYRRDDNSATLRAFVDTAKEVARQARI
jgi:DNA-binding transcriptional LysR family regulator